MKRKWWFAEILIGIYLTVAVFSVGWIVSYIAHQPAPICQNGEAEDKLNNCDEVYPNGPLEMVLLWLNSDNIIAVFTIILGIGTIYLVRDGRRHSRHSLRAYVFVDSVAVGDQGAAAWTVPENKANAICRYGHIAAHWLVKNTGQTPAYNVIHWGHVLVADTSDEETLVAPKIAKLSVSTVPTDGVISKTVFRQDCLTPEDVRGIESGIKAIYAYGRIEYDDAFRRHRYTNYRMKYGGQYPPSPNMTMTFCDRGNDTDESD